MTRDWLLGLLSGLIGATFGVVLYAFWDLWKEQRTNKRRGRALKEIVQADLSTNLLRVRSNLGSLNHELSMLSQRMSLVEPLPLLRIGFWEILRLEPSSKFFRIEEKSNLHELYDLTERINERLRAREQFKVNNGAMSNFESIMKIHDDGLIKELAKLKESLQSLESENPGEVSPQPPTKQAMERNESSIK